MGNAASWLAQCFYPEDQVFWAAAHYGDARIIRSAASRLTPETRKFLEWQEPYTGRTALLEAAAKGHVECARLLIETGANCNAKDLKMNTPLHLACKRAHPEMVKLLLEVPAVNPFEINLYMKTPLDLARSRFSNEEEEKEAQPYAKCIEVLEKKFCLYSGWLYVKTDNVVSFVSGISSLNSWTRRLCIVLERGEPGVLELALFSMKQGGGVRPVCPTSVMLYSVASGMEASNDPRWFSRKDFTFIVRGDQLNKCHYRASSALQTPVHFAAINQASFDAWKDFFLHQQQQLTERTRSITNLREQLRLPEAIHDNVAGWNPQSYHPEPSPALPVSAPDWDDWAASGKQVSTMPAAREQETASSTSERKPPVINYGDTAAHSSIGECVICFDGPQSAVCVPCGHNAVCMKCAKEILTTSAECPVCRTHIRELIKLYRV
ncbi:C3HC4 type zinc finger [Phytophthora infestans]|uniref:C3HC4 type zinc finger n=1 Tax=Phytophthora infestans TaxID=4787 RepID=A0A8S9TMT6_PHYIN|nr:C3HC4 type zinc finger [Phytophthora infestans]